MLLVDDVSLIGECVSDNGSTRGEEKTTGGTLKNRLLLRQLSVSTSTESEIEIILATSA